MANPITWRNVNAPSAGGAADLFGQAQASFDGAIKAVQDTKDGFEKGRTDRNTQEFMSQLQQYGSSEELAAAQQSGALADLRSQFGSMVDQDKVGADAVTDRVTNLQGRETAQYDRDQMLTERTEKPLVDAMNASIANIDLGQSADSLKAVLASQEQKIDAMDAGDATKTQLRGNLDARATASKGEFRNNRNDAQGQVDRGQVQADRTERKALEQEARSRTQAFETMNADLSNLRADAGSPAEARSMTDEFIRNDPRADLLSPTQINTMTADAVPDYKNRFGLLDGQLARIDIAQGDADDQYTMQANQAERELNEARRIIATPNYLSYMDENQVTTGDAKMRAEEGTDDADIASKMEEAESYVSGLANGQVKASSPRRMGRSNVIEEDNGSQDFVKELQRRKDAGLVADGVVVPWGKIADNAMKLAIENEIFSDENDVNLVVLKKGYQREYLNWLDAEQGQKKLFAAEQAHAQTLAGYKAESKAYVAGVRKTQEDINTTFRKRNK